MTPDFTLRQARYFIAVAEAGSLRGAADVLFVSQPALSSAISELESAIGVQLCLRQKSRGVTLTPNGVVFLDAARQLVRIADEMMWTTTANGQLRGPLTIGCFFSFAPDVLPGLISGFQQLHPQVVINFVEGGTSELEDKMFHGEIDLALLYDFGLDPRLRRMHLFSRSPHIILPAAHPLAATDPLPLTALRDEPFIQVTSLPGHLHTAELLAHADVVPSIKYRVSTTELANALVAEGFGYTIIARPPRSPSEYAELNIVAVRIAPPPPPMRAVAALAAHMPLSARAEAFLDFLRQRSFAHLDS